VLSKIAENLSRHNENGNEYLRLYVVYIFFYCK